jgi:hypothetical protein
MRIFITSSGRGDCKTLQFTAEIDPNKDQVVSFRAWLQVYLDVLREVELRIAVQPATVRSKGVGSSSMGDQLAPAAYASRWPNGPPNYPDTAES